jgi:membrane protein
MPRRATAWRKVTAQPGHFALQVLRAFQKNQGLLLSGALAYYVLLSVIPLFTFLLLMLSHVVDETALMATLRRYIGLIIPGDSRAVLEQVRNILEHREVASWVVLGAMLFFSSLAFSVLESAMSIIFVHRGAAQAEAADRLIASPLPLHRPARSGLPRDDRHCEPAAIDE